jgi:5'-3' exonuclease
MIDVLPHYKSILGKWSKYGFRLEEVEIRDGVDAGETLLVLKFHNRIVGSYYKSKIIFTKQAAHDIQLHCKRYIDKSLKDIITG